VNQFTQGGAPPGEILRVKPELEEKQKLSVARVRAERNAEAAKKALARVEAVANDGQNLMPPIVDAIRNWCTLGEISDAMRKVFGEYKPVNTL
jgi:methylmalonyl-CoA mutase N-terminal domain/subunit